MYEYLYEYILRTLLAGFERSDQSAFGFGKGYLKGSGGLLVRTVPQQQQ